LGLLSSIKRLLVQPTPLPTASIPLIQSDFEFKFLPDPQRASLNSKPLPANQNLLKFLVAGHTYGKPGNDEFHPSPNLVNNIALLKRMDLDFVVFLGDMVWKPIEEDFILAEQLILDQFNVPVFNAVGNHDVTNREIYQNRYGDTVFAFRYKRQLFIFLDTTLKYYDLTPEQYTFINKVLKEESIGVDGIHIFMHHVLFLEDDEVMSKQLLKPNEGDGQAVGFLDFVRSELVNLSKEIPIIIYSGDVGAFDGGNLSPFYKKFTEGNIRFLATGLGGNPFDSVLLLEAIQDGGFSIQPFSLTDKIIGDIEDYSFQDWLLK
jgi:hypothetical protein